MKTILLIVIIGLIVSCRKNTGLEIDKGDHKIGSLARAHTGEEITWQELLNSVRRPDLNADSIYFDEKTNELVLVYKTCGN